MFHSLQDQSSIVEREWRTETQIRRLRDELGRTQDELALLRSTTARLMTAVLTELHGRKTPVAEVSAEICQLAELGSPGRGPGVEDPVTGEVEVIDLTNRASMAYLDRRFRFVPSRRAHG